MLKMERLTADLSKEEQESFDDVSVIKHKVNAAESPRDVIESFYSFMVALTYPPKVIEEELQKFVEELKE